MNYCSPSPQYSHIILVGGYPVLQLSIDHNTDVQYQVKHRLYMYLQASVPYPIQLTRKEKHMDVLTNVSTTDDFVTTEISWMHKLNQIN